MFFFLSLAVFNSHLFARLFVCSPVGTFVCSFVRWLRLLFCSLFEFRFLLIPSPLFRLERRVLLSRSHFLSDRLAMRRYWKYNYISRFLFLVSYSFRNLTKLPRNLFNLKQLWRCKPRYFTYYILTFNSQKVKSDKII